MSNNSLSSNGAGSDISLSQAVAMTQLYRANKNQILKQGTDINILPICETFNKDLIADLLSIPDCAFLRIYYGMSDNLYIHSIVVAADASGADILPQESEAATNQNDGKIKEEGQRCPPECPPPSPLNG